MKSNSTQASTVGLSYPGPINSSFNKRHITKPDVCVDKTLQQLGIEVHALLGTESPQVLNVGRWAYNGVHLFIVTPQRP